MKNFNKALITSALLFGLNSVAQAEYINHPGSVCRPEFDENEFFIGSGGWMYMADTSRSVTVYCPMEHQGDEVRAIQVNVIDNHANADVTCRTQVANRNGREFTFGPANSSSGTGVGQRLILNTVDDADLTRSNTSLVIACTLPPSTTSTHVGGASVIQNYRYFVER